MYYYTLTKAGDLLSQRTGLPVDGAVLLQAGVVGSLKICAALVGRAHPPTQFYRLERVMMAPLYDRLAGLPERDLVFD